MAEMKWNWRDAGFDFGYMRGLTHQLPSLFDFMDCYSFYEAYNQSVERKRVEYEWTAGFVKGYKQSAVVKIGSNYETMDWPVTPGFRHVVVTGYGARLYLHIFTLRSPVREPMWMSFDTNPFSPPTTVNFKTRDDYYFRLEGRKASGPYTSEKEAIAAGYEYLKHLGFQANQRFSS